MAIEALVPESIASMRCEIGCPISMFAPDRIDSFCPVRFDVVEVDGQMECHWIKNAFEYLE